ncbi:hypothetical protein B0H13DRAFT_1900433 [Mycena leptocephala]|nr:hypothetical protein B0H13DRAFT_1900433 [Mycena leptocephala]
MSFVIPGDRVNIVPPRFPRSFKRDNSSFGLGAQWDGDWIQNNPKRGFSPLGYATLRRDWLRSLSGGTEGLQQIICMCILAEGPNSIKIFGRTLPSGANKISEPGLDIYYPQNAQRPTLLRLNKLRFLRSELAFRARW